MTHDNVTDIVERLVAEKYESDEHGIWAIPRNPEGREAAQEIATLRKQLENAREALRPFALAAQKGSNVYAGVQMAMKDRPDLFSYSTAYIDAGRSTAHSHLSWSDYVEAREAYEALKGQP